MVNEELIKKAQQNDVAAVEEIYNQYYPMGVSLALQMVKNEQDAMDIVQEAFITVFNKLEGLEDPEKFKSWYMQIVANKCRDFFKKKNPLSFTDANMYDEEGELQFEQADDDKEFQPEESVDYSETKRIISDLLDNLPEDQKMCLLLFYVNDMKITDIAKALNVSEATVKSRLKYGKDKLRVSVSEYEDKNGIKLHGVGAVSIIPLLRFLFAQGSGAKIPALPFAQVATQIAAASTAAAGTAAATATTTAATTATVGGIKAVVGSILGAIGGIKTLAIGAVAVAVVAGVIGGSVIMNNKNSNTDKGNDNFVAENNEITHEVVTKFHEAELTELNLDEDFKIEGFGNGLIIGYIEEGENNYIYGAYDFNGNIAIPFVYNNIAIRENSYFVMDLYDNVLDESGYYYNHLYFTHLYDETGKLIYECKEEEEIGEEIIFYDKKTVFIKETYYKDGEEKVNICLKKLDGTLIKRNKGYSKINVFNEGEYILSSDSDNEDVKIITVDIKGNVLYSGTLPYGFELYENTKWDIEYEEKILVKDTINGCVNYVIERDLTKLHEITSEALGNDWCIQGIMGDYVIINFSEIPNLQLGKLNGYNLELVGERNDKPFEQVFFGNGYINGKKYAMLINRFNPGAQKYISLNGEILNSYEEINYFYDGKSFVKEDGKYFLINERFEAISEKLDLGNGNSYYDDGVALVVVESNHYIIRFE